MFNCWASCLGAWCQVFNGFMFRAKFVQAAIENYLENGVVQKRNDRVPIHIHTNSTALNSNQGTI